MANYQLQTRLFEDFAGDLLQAAEANSNMFGFFLKLCGRVGGVPMSVAIFGG